MKIFKRVYYPIMAALVILMLVLGIVDSRVGMSGGSLKSSLVSRAYDYAAEIASHNSFNPEIRQAVNDYIVNTLEQAGAEVVTGDPVSDLDEDGKNYVEYYERDDELKPSVYVQKATVYQDSQANGESAVAVSREVNNVIFAVPGKGDGAILLHARIDGTAIGGASDSAAAGALLLNAVKAAEDFTAGVRYENTLVFLFGDAGQEGDLGACAFVNQFSGFNGVSEKICAVADYRINGTGGTLMMYGESDGNLNLIGKYAHFNGGTFASSALSLLTKNTEGEASGVFGDYNTLSFTNRDGFNRYGTATDTEVNKKLVSQQANAMNKFVKAFANTAANKVDSKSSAVYFSYLDVMTVYYPTAVAFVIAGIIAGLVIAIVILNIKNKAFSWGKALAGVAVQLVTLIAASVAALALYYLFALLLSGFGVLPYRGISAIKFAGSGLMLSATAFALVFAVFFYIILKRTFAVKASDVVRGNALLWAAVAFVLSFAAPAISYPFTCVALFSLTAMLMTVIFKRKFKNKFGVDIERLFLYVWSIVFALPLIMPLVFAAQTLYPLVSIVAVSAIMISLCGFITPYADYLKPVIDRGFKKLPMRSVRYVRTVTEKVEDRAKKGKFTEVTVKKVVTEKEHWNYHNRIGLSAAAIISAILVIIFGSINTTFSSAALGETDYYNSVYDDSLVLVYEQNGSSEGNLSVEVHDKIAYNYIRYAVNDLNWDSEKNAYTKAYSGNKSAVLPVTPTISARVNDKVTFGNIPDIDKSQIIIKLTGASSVTKVSFTAADASESEEYEFTNREELTFYLPYGYELESMKVDADCSISYEQHVYDINNWRNIAGNDPDKLDEYYASNKSVGPYIRGAMVIKIRQSL